jgi:hypothetical protein
MPSSSLALHGRRVIHMALLFKNDLTLNTVAPPEGEGVEIDHPQKEEGVANPAFPQRGRELQT